jgi:uncharacterized protein YggU (UPF0235/DUF167 family)
MREKKILFLIFLICIFSFYNVSGALKFGEGLSGIFGSSTNNYQYSSPNFNTIYSSSELSRYWPILRDIENEQCEATSDFIVAIRPGSCTPMVVRSDILEEQNVPVFCQLDAIRINPLIKASSIKSISFQGDYPKGVAGISFHPARAAIKSYNTLLGSPLLNNIGYVVIILKQNKVEKDMPDWVYGNLTATIYYDAEKAFGVGKAEFYSPVLSDEDWSLDYKDYGFWSGKGYLRVEDIQDSTAKIGLYTGKGNVYRNIVLKEGETSGLIYFPGFYCKAGLKVKLNDITGSADEARLNIDGDEIWVRKGSEFLNGRCSVRDLVVMPDKTGRISISCSGQKIELSRIKAKALISVDNVQNSFLINDVVDVWEDDGNERLTLRLVYAGEVPKTITDKDLEKKENGEKVRKNFILLTSSEKEVLDSKLNSVFKRISDISSKKIKAEAGKVQDLDWFKDQLKSSLGWFVDEKDLVFILEGEDVKKIDGFKGNINFIGFEEKEQDAGGSELNKNVKKYFDKSNKVVDELVDLYPNEQRNIENYGEESLWEQINLAKILEQTKTQEQLLEKLINIYPNSFFIEKAQYDLDDIKTYDLTKASSNVYVNNKYHNIFVSGFKPLDKTSKNIQVNVLGEIKKFTQGDVINIPLIDKKEIENRKNIDKNKHYVIDKIEPDEVVIIENYKDDDDKSFKTKTHKLKKEGKISLAYGHSIIIDEIFVDKVAYISLIPEIKQASTKAEFTFKIGIEKRGIKLSPEKTKEMIKNLNKTISDWEEINEKLGELVKAWKGACFATSSFLMINNFISGIGGETIARQQVMKVYKNICDTNPDYKGMSRTQCYNALAEQINQDVANQVKIIEKINKDIKEKQKQYEKEKGLFDFGTTYVDSENAFQKEVVEKAGDKSVEIKIPGQEKLEEVELKNLRGWEDYRLYLLVKELKEKGTANPQVLEYFKKKRDSQFYSILKTQEQKQAKEKAVKTFSSLLEAGEKQVNIKSLYIKEKITTTWDGDVLGDYPGLKKALGEKDDDTKIQLINDGSSTYVFVFPSLVILERMGSDEIYKIEKSNGGLKLTRLNNNFEKEKLNKFKKYSFVTGGKCENSYLNPSVRFYETEPGIKLPAIVPIDLQKGWYVKVPQSVGGLFSSTQEGYQASGAVSFFYICNVGDDGREENGGTGDICQSFNINNYNKVKEFIGCPELEYSEIQRLVEQAQQVIKQAAQQYGKRTITLNTGGKTFNIDIGQPVRGDGEVYECQDFMSPEECKLLFNVCDPVICPPSRCNLGGKYTVSNVVQTGIIGSIVLCLPNIREDIAVPICLTGIHAGIDSYISILKSEEKCLQQSLETGEHVGICDVVTSVYLCEFFWNQLAPLLDILVPNIIEFAYTGGVSRGGGEYLTVMHSWDTLQKSIDYFKNNYAQNAFRAFEYRNIQEAGGEFCRAFIGTSLPGSAELLDSLLEPESPSQFYAWFDERVFTKATVPSTSHYKIYYHIYAGNDKGVQYAVYLKNPPATSYYASNPKVLIKTGFIARGDEADETIDFTAPSGYKELCVVIDAQEECGFRQVSSNFALDYLRDKYIQKQGNKSDITTEKECISGSPSALALVGPNIQAGVEEAVNPKIDLRGIVRVCASENPGLAVDEEKWKEVGYCGNSNIKCWLDLNSLKEEIEVVENIDKELESLEKEVYKIDDDKTLTEEASEEKLGYLRERVRELKSEFKQGSITILNNGQKEKIEGLINDLKEVIEDGYLNVQKAEALSLKASVYRILSLAFLVQDP